MTSPDISACRALFHANATSALFVTSQLRPRELKMADGLRRLGWKVGLIYYEWTPFDPHAYFDFCFAVSSAAEAHALARQLSPRISHVFSGAIDDFVLQFCRDKPSPVVIDLNDVFAPSLFDYCHERFEPTREALALADGFCARDLQVKSAERADGFRLPRKIVFFPEYCWNSAPPHEDIVQRSRSDEVHVVSVGTFSLETQGMYDSCYLRLTNLLIEQRIHFHIYPHWAYRRDHAGSPHANFERDFADFLALQEASPYLHLHESLPIEELAKVLPRYDYGLVSGGAAEFGQKLGFYYPAYLETCYSGRISDYLDARLPVLINDEVKFDYWLLKRYGICVDLKGALKAGFGETLLKRKRDLGQREAVERAAQRLSVAANAPRLAHFYQDVVATGAAIVSAHSIEPGHSSVDGKTGESTLSGTVPATKVQPAIMKRFSTVIREKIRWASPRLAKILLPFRAIRIFEFRLHNALQELQANSITIANLHGKVGTLQQENDQIRAQVTAFEQEQSALQRENSVLSLGLRELELDKEALSTHVEELGHDKEALSFTIEGLKLERASQDASVAGLNQIREILATRVADLEQDKVGLRGQVAGMERDKEALATHIAGLEQDKVALHTHAAGLEADKTAYQAREANFEKQRSALGDQVAALEQGSLDLGSKVANLGAENNALQLHADELEVNNKDLRGQLESLNTKIAAFTQQVHVLSNEKFILQQETRWGKMSINEIAGVLNWPEVLNDFERSNGFSDFVRVLGLFSRDTNATNQPSACWDLLSSKNYDQLLTYGYNNFKRTVGNNYFNFLVQKGDPQISALEALLPGDTVKRCEMAAASIADDPAFPGHDQLSYKYFVLMLWEYARSIDVRQYGGSLTEPEEGNPILIPSGGQSVSQDLANSLIEYYSINEAVAFEDVKHVLEIGGGYGRNAYVILRLNPHIRVTMVDIPPALYLAQRYLSSVFKERRVFKARAFSRYEEVKEELEAASIVFLMPHQASLLPAKSVDLCMNISSFGEMDAMQVKWYFKQLEKITGRYFYLKQWRTSNNVFDGVVLKQSDYPYPKKWGEIYARPCRVQTEFFEALYRVNK